MLNKPSLAIRIFEGVPRFAGELFRATKVPSIVFLVAFFGVPITLSLVETIAAVYCHCAVPAHIFMAAMLQIPLNTPGVTIPPNLLNMLHQMTPRQLAAGIWLANFMLVDALVVLIMIVWWVFKAKRFLTAKWSSRRYRV